MGEKVQTGVDKGSLPTGSSSGVATGPKSLASLQRKHRELTERIRLAAKKERQEARKRAALMHQKLGSLVAATLPQEPGLHEKLRQLAQAAKWHPDAQAWLGELARPATEDAR